MDDFETHRRALTRLAYRMLGSVAGLVLKLFDIRQRASQG